MSSTKFSNPNLSSMESDVLYHLGLSSGSHKLDEMFGDVKFVCMGGTPHRMLQFAEFIMREIDYRLPPGAELADISAKSYRYAMYKVGPVLSVSHGMGVASLSVLLHELIKLLAHAGVDSPIFIRIGTSGGLDLPPGTVVVTEEALDAQLRPVHEEVILGQRVQRATHLSSSIREQLMSLASNLNFDVVTGKTVCTNDFYEGQGRMDGAFCEFSLQQKLDYLNALLEQGVRNIEMEATVFAALTHKAGIRAAVVCVTLLDRLHIDQLVDSKETMLEWQTRPQILVAELIKKHLEKSQHQGTKIVEELATNPQYQLAYNDDP